MSYDTIYESLYGDASNRYGYPEDRPHRVLDFVEPILNRLPHIDFPPGDPFALLNGRSVVFDVGAGRGQFMRLLLEKYPRLFMPVVTEACDHLLANDLRDFEFKDKWVLPGRYRRKVEVGPGLLVCSDVLEHLHPADIDPALKSLADMKARYTCLTVGHGSNRWGPHELHLTRATPATWTRWIEERFHVKVESHDAPPGGMSMWLCEVKENA